MNQPLRLTEDEAQRLFRVVRRLRDDGVGVIYISHRMREVRDLADRIAVLRDGRLVDERPTVEFPEAEIVQAMVGRPIADLYERGVAPPRRDRPFGAGPHDERASTMSVSMSVRAKLSASQG